MTIRRPLCLVCLVFLLGVYIFTGTHTPSCGWDVDACDGITVTSTATVTDRLVKNGTLRIYAKDATIRQESISGKSGSMFPAHVKGLVIKTEDSVASCVKMGSRITVRGVFEPFEPARCEGAFDARTYYMIRGYEGQLVRARITGVSSKYGKIREALRAVRDKCFSVLEENMSSDDAHLVAAMTLGDKTGLDSEVKELYQNAGISHVLALSGLHIASVGLFILQMLKKTGMNAHAASVTSFIIIALYAVMTGLSVSTRRAMIMFALFVVSSVIGRTYDLITAAAVSAIVVVIEDPYYIYDTGFLLSFGAILGIACVYPMLENLPGTLGMKKEPSGIYKSVCISLSVAAVTMPVTGSSFMQYPVLSVIINLAVIPLMGVVLFTGFTGMAVGIFGLRPSLILKITHYILAIFRFLSETSEKIKGNIILIGKPESWQIITYAVILIMAVLCENLINNDKYNNRMIDNNINPTGQHNSKNNYRYPKTGDNKITYIIETEADRKKKRKRTRIFHVFSGMMIAVSMSVLMIHPRSDLEIRNVDVGQGDCALVWGKDIPVVMIDGGSSDVKQPAKNRVTPVLKANRIKNIDYCFLTHPDSDHVNAVIEMLEDDSCPIGIKRLIISKNVQTSFCDNENVIRIFTGAKKRGVKIMEISAGQQMNIGDITVTCVSPDVNASRVKDENDDSLVLLVSYYKGADDRFSGLFTGDASVEVEKTIRSGLYDVDYLKVGHHGSRTSTSTDLLKAVKPELSVISVGEGNSYGHPTPETIQRLKDSGSLIYRTDLSGEVITSYNNGKITVRSTL